jgi:hypothetical protein
MTSDFQIKPRYAALIRWSKRGSCGESGCPDPECACSLCGQPIGVSERDPRWEEHDEFCADCELCRDQAPIMLWRGKGKQIKQAQFHTACFEKILFVRQGIPT